jgi:ATP-binding cassette subfamily C protein/ATP-binding cassette subfamily C protein LapB
MSAESAVRSVELQDRSAILDALSQFLNSAAGLAVLVSGTFMVLDGSITVGALIASMALTWRILSPAQQLFQTLGRLGRLSASIRTMNQMLRLTDEYDASIPNLARAPRKGTVALSRVSLRYGKDAEPALININLGIPAGKMIALTGPNGAGKSTVLHLVQGLYQPQAGIVTVDGLDIRQLSPKLLRRAIASVPQKVDLFYGTVAQNLRMGDPLASDATLRAAARETGILEAIEQLPEGFETRLGDSTTQKLSPSFLRLITVARALVRKAPILLIDEPESALSEEGTAAVQRLFERLRGTRTVIFVSHRPSYIRLADFAIFLRSGQIEYGGAPEGAIERLLGVRSKTGKAA